MQGSVSQSSEFHTFMNEMDFDHAETNPRNNETEKIQRKLSFIGLAFELEKLQKERSDLFKLYSKIKAKHNTTLFITSKLYCH